MIMTMFKMPGQQQVIVVNKVKNVESMGKSAKWRKMQRYDFS